MGPKVRAACTFVEQTGGRAVIGSITTPRRCCSGEAGTTVSPAPGGDSLDAAPRTP